MRQDNKSVDVTELFTADSLNGVILQKHGARDKYAKLNAFQHFAIQIQQLNDLAERLNTRYGRVPFMLTRTIERLEQYGNFLIMKQLDAQSQATVATGDKPDFLEVD